MELKGIHHVSAITANAEKNFDFYTRILGMRLVKKLLTKTTLPCITCFMPMKKDVPEPI